MLSIGIGVLTELKNIGVKDIYIAAIAGLAAFKDAIKAIYPNTEVQRCIIHQIRNITKYISYKHRKEFYRDLKDIYVSSTEQLALISLENLRNKWEDLYSILTSSWQNNCSELLIFFKYPEEIRIMIYTTNAMERFNGQLRKVKKSKSIFPSDNSLMKMLYLATQDVAKKWIQNLRG